MELSARLRTVALGLGVLVAAAGLDSRADPQALEKARGLLSQVVGPGGLAIDPSAKPSTGRESLLITGGMCGPQ